MQTYLMKRGNVYYFRRTIPAELREIIGRLEFTRSLRTKDLATAKRLCNAEASKTDEALERAAATLLKGVDAAAKRTSPAMTTPASAGMRPRSRRCSG